MDRAYSILTVKSVDDDRRVIIGMATTPTPDRAADVVEPMGVKVASDIPLFMYHDSTKTVGRVRFQKATADGIPFEATIPKITEPGVLKDRIDEAWQMVKYKLITGVSIGFRPIEGAIEQIKNGGFRFLKSEVLELSLVPIPMNAEATISTVKSIDSKGLAASGHTPGASHPPGVSGTKVGPAFGGAVNSRTKKANQMKTTKELREMRETKAARLQELVDLFKSDGYEANDEDAAEFDGLTAEVKAIDQEIRIASFSTLQGKSGVAIGGSTEDEGSASRRGPTVFARTQDPDDKFKGQSFTRLAIAKAAAYIAMKDGNYVTPAQIAEKRWGKSHPQLVRFIKAAVAGGGTGSGEWGAELAQSDTRYNGDFIEFLYSMTVFDRLPLRSVPGRVHIKGQDGASTGYWVGESKAIPVSTVDFSDVELTPLKVGAIAVCSKELVMDSDPSAEMWIRDSIAQASAQRVDTTFLSAAAAVAGVSPAGLLSGLTGGTPSGTDAAAVRADLKTMYAGFLAAKNAGGLVQITTPSLAKSLSLMVNALGQTEFAGLNANGGSLLGDVVYTGDNVTAGDWILLKPSDIWKIGDSGVQLSMSDSAMVEQDSAPTGATDTPVAASATMVSLWQEESVGFKVVRRINYAKRRSSAAAFMTGCAYA